MITENENSSFRISRILYFGKKNTPRNPSTISPIFHRDIKNVITPMVVPCSHGPTSFPLDFIQSMVSFHQALNSFSGSMGSFMAQLNFHQPSITPMPTHSSHTVCLPGPSLGAFPPSASLSVDPTRPSYGQLVPVHLQIHLLQRKRTLG
jgi:hypothetical protein